MVEDYGLEPGAGHGWGRPDGEDATVTAAYERYRDALQGHLVQITRDPEVAADLVQDAYMKLLLEVRDRETPDNIRAWLYRVAHNAAISRARRVRTATVFGERIPGPEPMDGPEDAYLRKEASGALTQLLADARPDERRALALAAHGADGFEIARAIGRTHGATRTLLHRARTRNPRAGAAARGMTPAAEVR